jgi:hypothetical protein
MRPSPARRLAALGLVTLPLAGLLGGPLTARPAAAAPAADPVLEIPLFTGFIGVRTAAMDAPTVEVTGADGQPRIEVTALGARPADGHWIVELREPGDPAAVLLVPGDRVAVTAGAQTTTVTVPAMSATAAADSDVLSGVVPPTSAVYVQLHRDATWFDGPDPEGQIVPVGAGGGFRLELAGRFDLAPGTYGEVGMLDAAGNAYFLPFAVPAVTLYAPLYYAAVRAEPPARGVVLSFEDGAGNVRFRSVPGTAVGGGLFLCLLSRDNRPEDPLFVPEPGDILVLSVDGRERVREPVPWLTATVDPAERAVAGLAPAGARLAVTLVASDAADAPSAAGVTRAGADGGYRLTLPELSAPGEEARATVVGYAGGGAAFGAVGRVPRQRVALFGHRLTGRLAGWGHLEVEHQPADGGPPASAGLRTDATGTFSLELYHRGEPVTIRPGDRLRLRPELGEPVTLTVPALTAESDPAARTVSGTAPASSTLRVATYAAAPDYFGNQQYAQPSTTLYGRADAAGRYTVRCAEPDCGTRYGIATVRLGTADFALEWVDVPLVGVGVSRGVAMVKGTAGSAVTLTPLDAAGQPLPPRTGLVRPALSGGLPEWRLSLDALYPAPLPTGTRLRLAVADRPVEVQVPALDWQVSPASDEVSGLGPPLHAYLAIAVAREEREPPAGAATGATDLAGRFSAAFEAFDVRPGDDAELYLLRPDHYLWWTATGVRDPEPEATATPTATPTATHRPPALYLPALSARAAPPGG